MFKRTGIDVTKFIYLSGVKSGHMQPANKRLCFKFVLENAKSWNGQNCLRRDNHVSGEKVTLLQGLAKLHAYPLGQYCFTPGPGNYKTGGQQNFHWLNSTSIVSLFMRVKACADVLVENWRCWKLACWRLSLICLFGYRYLKTDVSLLEAHQPIKRIT